MLCGKSFTLGTPQTYVGTVAIAEYVDPAVSAPKETAYTSLCRPEDEAGVAIGLGSGDGNAVGSVATVVPVVVRVIGKGPVPFMSFELGNCVML